MQSFSVSFSDLQAVLLQQCEAADSTFLMVGEAAPPRGHEGNEVGGQP